jgi:hypothetical protein
MTGLSGSASGSTGSPVSTRVGVLGGDGAGHDAARSEERQHLLAGVLAREQAGDGLDRQGRDGLVGDGRDVRLVVGDEVDEDGELLVGPRGEGALRSEERHLGIDVASDEALEQRHGSHGSGVPGSRPVRGRLDDRRHGEARPPFG